MTVSIRTLADPGIDGEGFGTDSDRSGIDSDRSGIDVVDHVEGRRFPFSIPGEVSLDQGDPDRFTEPVDAAVVAELDELELPHVIGVFVRDMNGETVAECHDFADETLPAGEYEFDLAAPMKIYLRASGPVTVRSTNVDMAFSFEEPQQVEIGARSYHTRPATTITSTADPEDLMAAVSTFGSALKTTSPERAFPSLRGHPPMIELGTELDIPGEAEPPETGLWIEIPSEREAVYAVATLAHYLGARVEPGAEPRLVADGETIRTLDDPSESGVQGGLEAAVTEILQQVFLLDCIVRTEGRYQLDLHERRELETRVELPFAELYDAPIAERVARYLAVPAETVRDLVPTWSLRTHLSRAPKSAELLSYAANTLSLISVERTGVGKTVQASSTARSGSPPGYDAFVRATESSPVADSSPESLPKTQYVRIPEAGVIERAWFGDGRSVNANDIQLEGVRNRLTGESTGGPIEIALVCNDERMAGEVGDGELYGDRDELPFDVTIHRELSRAELGELLGTELDFLHYVGHVERTGFVCRDGPLDAGELDEVGVDTFLLNGCRSYEQGRILVERGSVGGIVTHGAVGDPNATAVGRLVAGLLNAGFSLRAALTVAGQRYPAEGHYTVVGDGAVQIAQAENGTPTLVRVDRPDDSPDDSSDGSPDGAAGYEVRIDTYPAVDPAMGACYTPYASSVDRYFLVGGQLPPLSLSLPEVVNLLGLERVPAVVDGEFHWSTDVAPADLP